MWNNIHEAEGRRKGHEDQSHHFPALAACELRNKLPSAPAPLEIKVEEEASPGGIPEASRFCYGCCSRHMDPLADTGISLDSVAVITWCH